MLAEHRGQLAHAHARPRPPARAQRPGGDRDVGPARRRRPRRRRDALDARSPTSTPARVALDDRAARVAESLAAEELRDAQARAARARRRGAPDAHRHRPPHGRGGASAWLDVDLRRHRGALVARVHAPHPRPGAARHVARRGPRRAALGRGLDRRPKLALSTADLLFDARLPELPSLRLGRAQPPPRKGVSRAAPKGLDRMFEGHDRSLAAAEQRLALVLETRRPPAGRTRRLSGARRMTLADELLARAGLRGPRAGRARAARDRRWRTPAVATGARPLGRQGGSARARRMVPRRYGARKRCPCPRRCARARACSRRSRAASPTGSPRSAAAEAVTAAKDEAADDALPLEPEDAWLDFDSLRVKPASDPARRGRLVREADARTRRERERAAARRSSDAVAPAGRARPARDARDVRPPVRGRGPRRGARRRAHAPGPPSARPRRRRRCAGARRRERTPQVYREAELRNPFDAPLLGGPRGRLRRRQPPRGGRHRPHRPRRHDARGDGRRAADPRGAQRPRARGDRGHPRRRHGGHARRVDRARRRRSARPRSSRCIDRLPVTDDKDVEVEAARARARARALHAGRPRQPPCAGGWRGG
jgi:hypothetical protein